MAWYLILINFSLALLVIVGVCGTLLWAIASQRRDWPGYEPKLAAAEPLPEPEVAAAEPLPEPVLDGELTVEPVLS